MLHPGLLIDADDVATLEGEVVLLDTRLTTTGTPGRDQYDVGHLPGAVYVDLDDDLAEPAGVGGRHPLPTPERFVGAMRRAGVRRKSTVVVYDTQLATAAARLWWLLRDYGHDDVVVLNGGLAAWTAAGHPVSTMPTTPAAGDWTGVPGHLATVDAAEAAALTGSGVLVDVRAAERFRGETEPLDPIAGHIPGAVNAPLSDNTDESGRFRSSAELRERFEELGVTGQTATAAYCGSGVTACQTILALRLAGLDAALYPGSWSDWITDPTRVIATGG